MREGLGAAVDAGPVCGFVPAGRAAHAGEDPGDDLLAEGEQGREWVWVPALGRRWVVGGWGGGVMASRGVEPAGAEEGEEHKGERGAKKSKSPEAGKEQGASRERSRAVKGKGGDREGAEVGPAQPEAGGEGEAEEDWDWQWQLTEGAAGEEGDAGAAEGGGEPLGYAGEVGVMIRGKPLRNGLCSVALWCCALVALNREDVFAFGVGLEAGAAETDPERGEAVY